MAGPEAAAPGGDGSVLDRIVGICFRVLEVVLVLLLAGMVVMVFGNVVLRYGFDSGLDVSEEMSRYFFVWLIYLGAIVAFREDAHLGVDTLVERLPPAGRTVCAVVADLSILFCCWIIFWGTLQQAGVNATASSPVVGLPLIFVNGIGFVTSVAIAAMTGARLIRTLRGRRPHRPGEDLDDAGRDAAAAEAARSGRIVD